MTDVPQNPGTLLREQRQRLGMSTAEVAQQLNLKPNVIEQLEQLTLDGSVAPTFLRGYLKLYAKLLKLNEQQVLQQFEPFLQALTTPVAMHSFSHKTRRDAAENRFMLASYFLIVLLIGLSIVWFWQTHLIDNEPVLSVNSVADANALTGRNQTFVKPSAEPAAAVPAQGTSLAEGDAALVSADTATVTDNVAVTDHAVVAESAEGTANAGSPANAAQSLPQQTPVQPASTGQSAVANQVAATVTTDERSTAVVSAATPANVSTASETVSTVSSATAGAEAAGNNPAVSAATAAIVPQSDSADMAVGAAPVDAGVVQLQLSFTAQCWLEVTGADGKRLAYQMAAAGQQLQLSGVSPVKVVLGDPAAVQIVRNGQPVDLSSYQPGRAARLTFTGLN